MQAKQTSTRVATQTGAHGRCPPQSCVLLCLFLRRFAEESVHFFRDLRSLHCVVSVLWTPFQMMLVEPNTVLYIYSRFTTMLIPPT